MPIGWLRVIRESLGLSVRMLDTRVGRRGSVAQAERREVEKTISIGTLDTLARGMDCKLVYALIPIGSSESLESIVEARAQRLAEKILNEVTHTMRLEAQEVDWKATSNERNKLIRLLIEKLDGRLWEDEE